MNDRLLLLTGFALAGLPLAARAADATQFPLNIGEAPVSLSGYVDTSLMFRFAENAATSGSVALPNTARSPGRLYDVPERNGGFNLTVVQLAMDKPLETDRWSAGYHVEVIAGPDARVRRVWSLASGGADMVLNQANVAVHAPWLNGFEFRVGQFTSPIGYEVFESHRNPNYSRSYGYFIEPKAHTGVTVSYPVTDWLQVLAGVANTYSTHIDGRAGRETSKTVLALAKFTAPESWTSLKGADLSLGYTGGNTATSAPTDTEPRIHNFYAGARAPLPVTGLSLGVAFDYQANAAANQPAAFLLPAGPTSTYANATAIYVDYTRGKFSANTRAEYASGTAGNTIFASRDAFLSNKPMNGPNNVEFLGVTETLGYKVWSNVLTRMEARWDRDVSGGVPAFGSVAHPRQNSFTLTLSAVYQF